jgi:putative transposase
MKRSRFTDEQIAYALRQVDGGTALADVCRQMGISEATLYVWKKKYANLEHRDPGTPAATRREREVKAPGGRSLAR